MVLALGEHVQLGVEPLHQVRNKIASLTLNVACPTFYTFIRNALNMAGMYQVITCAYIIRVYVCMYVCMYVGR